MTLVIAKETKNIEIAVQWTFPQMPIMIIYNRTWSILNQWISGILSGDNLT